MRAFVALVPPVEAVEHLDQFLDVRREHAELRWTQADQVHVTLAFAEHVADRALDDLVERLGSAARRRRPFRVRIAGGGAFPDVGRARVVWAGLGLDPDPDGAELELGRLAAGCRAAAARAGVAVDGAGFRPHLTVARTRTRHDVTRWVRLLDSYVGPPWTVSEVELIESHLGQGQRGRPRHETVETFSLGS